jgi:hypothetical protein
MMTVTVQDRLGPGQAQGSLAHLVDAIGQDRFGPALASFLHGLCGADLYGMSSVGIALDLSVSEETVKTYRKRAYQRLNIGSECELLTWYLARWNRWMAQRFEAAAQDALPSLH